MLRWRSLRPLSGAPRPPHLAAPRGALEPVFTPNQFGVTVGPDGHVYVLGTDRTGAPDHLYVFEDDGTLLRAGAVPRDHALFADPDGHVYALAVTDALARTGEPPRAPFPSFALPELRTGETIALEDYRGRIVVLNFWASWCGPCRLEMPALDAYAGEIDSARVAVIGLNDDVNPDDARAFLAEFGIRYPSVKGQGHLKARYGYRGLPYTVILDRNLRLIRAIYGFGTTIAPIHEVVERELSSP
ncbi:MAG: redoxin domain-containing protein [Gemmatimonadetes bacterium]|nr:redoxin domain-containing protein [Gemmatimonadota bacterium]